MHYDGLADTAFGEVRREVRIIFGKATRPQACDAENNPDDVGDAEAATVDGFSGRITEIEALGDIDRDGPVEFADVEAHFNFGTLNGVPDDLYYDLTGNSHVYSAFIRRAS